MVNDDDCALKKAGRTPPSLSIILRIARENERRWCNTKRRAAISLPTRWCYPEIMLGSILPWLLSPHCVMVLSARRSCHTDHHKSLAPSGTLRIEDCREKHNGTREEGWMEKSAPNMIGAVITPAAAWCLFVADARCCFSIPTHYHTSSSPRDPFVFPTFAPFLTNGTTQERSTPSHTKISYLNMNHSRLSTDTLCSREYYVLSSNSFT